MTTQRMTKKASNPEIPHLPVPAGANASMKYLIAAVFAAGKDGCNCETCQCVKKLAGELSTQLLTEGDDNGH